MVDARTRSFDEFYRGTVDRVVHLVYATTGNRTLAEDCTQEAYAKAWRDWDRIRQHDDPLSWVRTVARRDAISQWRKDSNRARALVRHGVDAPAAGPNEDRVAVRNALQQLPDQLRETVALFYIADLSIDQIAHETGSPVGTVKARLHRGRAQLAELIRAHDPAGPLERSEPDA
jgi:RNA polymerase sigma-70 factor (ECF subfamily)